jgi:hypothetical protein
MTFKASEGASGHSFHPIEPLTHYGKKWLDMLLKLCVLTFRKGVALLWPEGNLRNVGEIRDGSPIVAGLKEFH